LELVAAGELAPGVSRNFLCVYIHAFLKFADADPAAAGTRIHNLEPSADFSPDDYEVSGLRREADDDDSGQVFRLREEDVIEGDKELFGIESESDGGGFDGVDGGTVDSGLAGFAEAAIACRDAEAFED
jgi:hypothetical protein